MILADTHALYWWLERDYQQNVSSKARHWWEGTVSGEREVAVSAVSLWELEYKRQRGRLQMKIPMRAVLPALQKLRNVIWIEPDISDWLLMAELPWAHRDPADRLIAATALNRGLKVLTKDRMFHEEDSPVTAVW